MYGAHAAHAVVAMHDGHGAYDARDGHDASCVIAAHRHRRSSSFKNRFSVVIIIITHRYPMHTGAVAQPSSSIGNQQQRRIIPTITQPHRHRHAAVNPYYRRSRATALEQQNRRASSSPLAVMVIGSSLSRSG
jgi:hypothetical protein